tara:strand:+ start:916 stop:1485 length:570 start_codon:yes stop_codon:yes gene_type:complete
MIRAGNNLEKMITEGTSFSVHPPSPRCKGLKYVDLQLDTLTQKTLVSKLVLKNQEGLENTDLDFAVIDPEQKKITIIEMKDGDNFDTKKASAETKKLFRLAEWLRAQHQGWEVSPQIVLWNNKDLERSSFKDKSAREILLNGQSAENLLGVNSEKINNLRKLSFIDNDKYVLQRMASIVDRARQGGEIL